MAHHAHSTQEDVQAPLSLSEQINASTREGHDIVNRLIMARLPLGLQDHRLYREGILSFAYVYKAFEDAWMTAISPTATTDPRLKAALQSLYSTPLLRTALFRQDLEYYYGSAPYSLDKPCTLQRSAYSLHIRDVVARKPHVLIAYAHNFYMGLFAGGKKVKYQISKAKEFFPRRGEMNEEECRSAGMNVFSFEVPRGKEELLRSSFKDAMTDLEGTLTTEEKADIIEESKAIFTNNELLIRELDQVCAYMALTTVTTSIRQMSTREFVRKYRLQMMFVALFSFAAIKLVFF